MISVLAAMEEELEVIMEVFEGEFCRETPEDWPKGRSLYRATVGDNVVVLAATGIGKICAASTAELVAQSLSPRAFIFCGCAGSLVPDLEVGDLVIANEVSQWDLGVIYPEDYKSLGSYMPGRDVAVASSWEANPVLVGLARDSAGVLLSSGWKGKVKEGMVITGDKSVWCSAHRDWLASSFKAVAVDMESASLAQVAVFRGIPFLVLRGISDSHKAEMSRLHTVIAGTDVSPARLFLRRGSVALFHPLEAVRMLRLMGAVKTSTRAVASLAREMLEKWDICRELDRGD